MWESSWKLNNFEHLLKLRWKMERYLLDGIQIHWELVPVVDVNMWQLAKILEMHSATTNMFGRIMATRKQTKENNKTA